MGTVLLEEGNITCKGESMVSEQYGVNIKRTEGGNFKELMGVR